MTLPTNTYTVTFSDAHSHTLAYSAVPAAGGNTMPGKMDALRNVEGVSPNPRHRKPYALPLLD